MFEVKWFLFKSEKEMNADKILPIDLYHAVSIANLTLESALKVIHVEAGRIMNCCLWNRELLL